MRKTFLTRGLVRFSRGLAGVALAWAATGITSCETHTNSVRSESIEVYADPVEKEPLDEIILGVKGGQAMIYVDSNIDFAAKWEDSSTAPWASVLDYTAVDPQTGMRVVTLSVKPRSTTTCYYTRRTGMLILSATNDGLNYNRIVPVHQGAVARVSNDFATMKYGKTDPRFTDGETPLENWTTAQKDYGFTSTTIEGEPYAHCYGKNGYIKLGDDRGHGADLFSPFTNTLRYDSILMVSFRAVAYTDHITRAKDSNRLTVEVLDGGVIADFADSEKTSIELEIPNYDVTSEEFPADMWKGSDMLVFVVGTKLNPITVNTRIRITCGSLTQPAATNSRTFIDNFYIRRLVENDEDYFAENNGSGRDIVLGSILEADEKTEQ